MDITLFWVWGVLILTSVVAWLLVFNDCTVRARFYEAHFWAFLKCPSFSFYVLCALAGMWKCGECGKAECIKKGSEYSQRMCFMCKGNIVVGFRFRNKSRDFIRVQSDGVNVA